MIEETDAGSGAVSKVRRMLTEKQVLALVPVSRATLYRMIGDGRFPAGTFISANRRIWYDTTIAAWQDEIEGRVLTRTRRGRKPALRVADTAPRDTSPTPPRVKHAASARASPKPKGKRREDDVTSGKQAEPAGG